GGEVPEAGGALEAVRGQPGEAAGGNPGMAKAAVVLEKRQHVAGRETAALELPVDAGPAGAGGRGCGGVRPAGAGGGADQGQAGAERPEAGTDASATGAETGREPETVGRRACGQGPGGQRAAVRD